MNNITLSLKKLNNHITTIVCCDYRKIIILKNNNFNAWIFELFLYKYIIFNCISALPPSISVFLQRCIVVQEIFPDGLAALDGRLQSGDQIIEVNGADMTAATHAHVCQELRKVTQPTLRLGVYRERIQAYRTTPQTNHQPLHSAYHGEEIYFITLPNHKPATALFPMKNWFGLWLLLFYTGNYHFLSSTLLWTKTCTILGLLRW